MKETNHDLAEMWEWSIREAITLNSEIEADEDESILFSNVRDVNTFKEKGILTTDNGVVVTLNDGSQIRITIQYHGNLEQEPRMKKLDK